VPRRRKSAVSTVVERNMKGCGERMVQVMLVKGDITFNGGYEGGGSELNSKRMKEGKTICTLTLERGAGFLTTLRRNVVQESIVPSKIR
jgi:hypothetical protein